MGCAASSNPRVYESSSVDLALSMATEERQLYLDFDQRTKSHASSADEPSDAMRGVAVKMRAMRGKLFHGINEDLDQFNAASERPDFKQSEKRRVESWRSEVQESTPTCGPEELPDGPYLPTPTCLSPSNSRTADPSTMMASTQSSVYPDLSVQDSEASVASSSRNAIYIHAVDDETSEP